MLIMRMLKFIEGLESLKENKTIFNYMFFANQISSTSKQYNFVIVFNEDYYDYIDVIHYCRMLLNGSSYKSGDNYYLAFNHAEYYDDVSSQFEYVLGILKYKLNGNIKNESNVI